MPKIVTVEQMRAIEQAADAAGVSYADMMERAGRAVAELVKHIIAEQHIEQPRVTVLVGKGNNGGDGLVAGRILAAEAGAAVSFFATEARDEADPVFAAVREAGLLVADAPADADQGYRVLRTMVANADIIVDGILGTGAKLPIKGNLQKILRQIHKALHDRAADGRPAPYSTPILPAAAHVRRPIIIAVDIPTGLDADSGALDPEAIHADQTITFEAAKPGLLAFPGAEAVGTLHVAPLGLPDKLPVRDSIKGALVDAASVIGLLPKRPASAHKYTFGKALVVAGSVNYTGAPSLAASGAYRMGAGLVTVAAPQPIIPLLATQVVEATWIVMPHDMGVLSKGAARVLREELEGYTALLIGPGLGHETPTAEFIDALFQGEQAKPKPRTIGFAPPPAEKANGETRPDVPLPPLIIDADGLNLLAKIEHWWTRLPANTILTPHAGEMARLCGIEDDEKQQANDKVNADRLGLAAKKAAEWNMIVVLKGPFTAIAAPDGRLAVLPFANAALARAGTGDVLAGMISGLLAQGLAPFDAAVVGGYVHGVAGELALQALKSPASVLATDVVAHIASALAKLES